MHKDSDLIRRGDARTRARDAFKEGEGAVDDALNDCTTIEDPPDVEALERAREVLRLRLARRPADTDTRDTYADGFTSGLASALHAIWGMIEAARQAHRMSAPAPPLRLVGGLQPGVAEYSRPSGQPNVDARFARTFDASFVMPDGSERPAITNACGNPAPAPKLYGGRSPVELDRAGNYFCRHVEAMTSEGLHSKADIAAELAWRDHELDRLKREAATAYDRGRLDEFRRGHTCVVCSCELLAHDAAPFCRDSCGLEVEESEGASAWLEAERSLDRAREAAR